MKSCSVAIWRGLATNNGWYILEDLVLRNSSLMGYLEGLASSTFFAGR